MSVRVPRGTSGDHEPPSGLRPGRARSLPPLVPRGTTGSILGDSSARILHVLEEGLDELGIADAELAGRLESLVELVFTWSARINLTGHRDRESIARGLVLDAIGLASLIPEASTLADLGSGAGFPGLPIALSRPGCRVTLVESRIKRHHFERAAIRQLALRNADARLGRAEVLGPTPHRVAVARAVAPLEHLVPWLMRWLEPGGLALVPIPRSRVPSPAGAETVGIRSYRVPGAAAERRVWVGRKPADL